MEQKIRRIIISFIEVVAMILFFSILDTQGIQKYIIVAIIGLFILVICYKNIEFTKENLVLLIPIMFHCGLGLILSFAGGTLSIWTFKTLIFWLFPLFVSFAICSVYANDRSHMIEMEFWGSVGAYFTRNLWYIQKFGCFESTFAFVFGLFILYYAWKHQWLRMGLALICMYFANKRIAVVAVVCCLILLSIMKVFKYDKKRIHIFWTILIVVIGFYIYSICSGLFFDLCMNVGIDTNHRIEVYSLIADMIPKKYLWGKGLGTTNEMLMMALDSGLYKWFENPHNDFLKIFVDLGTLGLVLFLVSYLILFYLVGKKNSKRTLSFIFVVCVYFMLLMTTDNVSIYIIFLVPMYSIFLSLLNEKEDWL